MEELFKARIQQAVNKVIRRDTNISPELLEEYKESLVASTCDIFAALSDMYNTEEEMNTSIEEYMKENYEDMDHKDSKGYTTDSYMVASIPIILPIEAIAILDKMDDIVLPLVLSQLSEGLYHSIIALKTAEKLGDVLLEKGGQNLADILKRKGWVA